MPNQLCEVCRKGEIESTVLSEFSDDTFGLPVTLINCVVEEKCPCCGDVTVEIMEEDKLSTAIAMARILIPMKFSGKEIRFLRKALGLKAKEFAKLIGITPETVSRWESGQTAGIGGFTDMGIRFVVGSKLSNRAPGIEFDSEKITDMVFVGSAEEAPLPPLVFELISFKSNDSRSKEWDSLQSAA